MWLGDTPVATLQPNGASVAIYYVETDQLDTPRAVIVPSNNAVRWAWYVRPFGSVAPNQNPQNLGNFTYDLRFPGQIAGTWGSTYQNNQRDFDPTTGRYVESDPIGLFAGINTYAYVGDDPVYWVDPLGLDVQVCRAPAQIAGGFVDHVWIKTSTKEAGMGGPDAIPGDQYEALYITKVYIKDHTGQSATRQGASCRVVEADENKVDDLLKIGQPLGRFSPWNNCQTFAGSVLMQATSWTQRSDNAIRSLSEVPGALQH